MNTTNTISFVGVGKNIITKTGVNTRAIAIFWCKKNKHIFTLKKGWYNNNNNHNHIQEQEHQHQCSNNI